MSAALPVSLHLSLAFLDIHLTSHDSHIRISACVYFRLRPPDTISARALFLRFVTERDTTGSGAQAQIPATPLKTNIVRAKSRHLHTYPQMGNIAIPMPAVVGALKCQQDSYLQTLETEVISCTEYVPPKAAQQSGKAKTKKSTDPTKFTENGEPSSKTYLIELADSVLFPEGGGQPTDHGTLTPIDKDSGDSIPITNIQRHGLRCIHFSPEPLAPGATVRQTVNFPRRWDHMQQHTGQHLLSAIMDKMDLETVGWSMAAAGEMNYVELPRKPTDEEIKTIQAECNEAIRENIPITVETPEGKGSNSLPDDYDSEKGVVRFIKIGHVDYNACCGKLHTNLEFSPGKVKWPFRKLMLIPSRYSPKANQPYWSHPSAPHPRH